MTNFNYGPGNDVTIIEETTFTDADGVLVDRLVVDVHGHDVQIVSYDKGPQVVVKVDEHVRQMNITQVDHFIRSNTC